MFLPKALEGLNLEDPSYDPPILLFMEEYDTELTMLRNLWPQASLSLVSPELVRDGFELQYALPTKTSILREDILLAFVLLNRLSLGLPTAV